MSARTHEQPPKMLDKKMTPTNVSDTDIETMFAATVYTRVGMPSPWEIERPVAFTAQHDMVDVADRPPEPPAKQKPKVTRVIFLGRALHKFLRRGQRAQTDDCLAPAGGMTVRGLSAFGCERSTFGVSPTLQQLQNREPGDRSSTSSMSSRHSVDSCPASYQRQRDESWLAEDDLDLFADIPSPRYQTAVYSIED